MTSPAEIAYEIALSRPAGRRTAQLRHEEARAAFGELVADHAARMRAVALRLVAPQDADDLVQEALAKAWRGLRSFRREADVRTWLYRILVNACRDHHRRRGRALAAQPEGSRPERSQPDDPAHALAGRELVARILAAIDDLPARQRECLLLRVHAGLAYREIARVLAIRRGSVKAHLVEARRTLVQRFGRDVTATTGGPTS